MTITVQGTEYATTEKKGALPLAELSALYIVHRALQGDELAIEILNAAKSVVIDAHGNQVWPVLEDGA
jgi:hypothetical protein